MVRRGEEAAAISLWLRTFLHHVCVFEFKSNAGGKGHGKLHRQERRQTRRIRNRTGLCRAARQHQRTSKTLGGMEQSEVESRRKQRRYSGNRAAISVDL